jgi:hypothetical protein
MFHTCENGPPLPELEDANSCFSSQSKDLRRLGLSLKIPKKFPDHPRTVSRKESRLPMPVQNANDGKSAVMDDSHVGSALAAGLRNPVTMTNIDRESSPRESAQFQNLGWWGGDLLTACQNSRCPLPVPRRMPNHPQTIISHSRCTIIAAPITARAHLSAGPHESSQCAVTKIANWLEYLACLSRVPIPNRFRR